MGLYGVGTFKNKLLCLNLESGNHLVPLSSAYTKLQLILTMLLRKLSV